MYKKAFWVLIIVTVISMIFQIVGYEILETVIFLIIMDFIALWLYLEKKKDLIEIDNNNVIKKIENLEKSCSSILEGIGSVSSVISLEEKINKQKEDVNSMLEKINEKTLVLEEKLNNFGQSLSNYVTSSNKALEIKKETLDKE
jgi:hypothetical protein